MQKKFKKDRFSKARGGNSHLLEISCAKCGSYVATYQKDGIGSLIRMYVDRIVKPESYLELQSVSNKANLPKLVCVKCGNMIGIPMVYEPENRLAFRLIRGNYSKRNTD